MTLTQWLRDSGLPRLEARLLVQSFLGWPHAQIITQAEYRLPETVQAALSCLAQRRLQGEPMAYILGEKEFYGAWFKVNSAVLIPRPETEHLVEAALDRLPETGAAWDLGSGSGIVAITLKRARPAAAIWGSDISPAALAVAQENADRLGAAVHWRLGSWFDIPAAPAPHSLDVVVSNPPYIDAADVHLQQGDLRFEPKNALTDHQDGLSAIRTLVAGAATYLKPGGTLLLEHGFDQAAAVQALFRHHGWTHIQTLPDLAGLDRITLGVYP